MTSHISSFSNIMELDGEMHSISPIFCSQNNLSSSCSSGTLCLYIHGMFASSYDSFHFKTIKCHVGCDCREKGICSQ